MKLKGPKSKPLRKALHGMPEPSLDIPSTLREDVRLRIVHKYRHLGHQVPFTYKQDEEIRARVAQARAAYAKHRRTIYQNVDIPLHTRARLLNCMVISILAYNQGTWNPLSQKSYQHFSGAVLGFYRGLIRPTVGREALLSWSDERVLATIRLPGPQELLHLARLRYAGSLWRSAPLEVWWSVHFCGNWFPALHEALLWLNAQTCGLDTAAGARWRSEHWHEIIRDARQWKGYLQKALRHSVEQRAVTEHLHRWHFTFLERAVELGLRTDPGDLLQQGLALDAPQPDEVHPHACILCQETFSTFAAWSVHANRKHGGVAPERLLLAGTSCRVCCKEYHTSNRLLRHLRHSTRCAALLNGQQPQQQAVRPGVGNTHLDKDRPLPLPVCALEDASPVDFESTEPVPVRSDYSRPLYCSLLDIFDAWIVQPDHEEEALFDQCIEALCSTIEPIFLLQNTVDKLLDLFVADEDQMLHRVAFLEILAHVCGIGSALW